MLPTLFPNGLKKAFTVSYDDGCYDDLKLIELMKTYGIRGTFNISSGLTRPEGQPPMGHWERMTKSERAAYNTDFVEVALHGETHRDFTKITEPELVYEIMSDKAALEKEFNVIVKGAAYPYGSFNDLSVELLHHSGVKYCRTVWSDYSLNMPADWLRLRPTAHHDDPKLPEVIEKFLNEDPKQLRMLYIWGHTPEFKLHNNWEMIEEYFKKLSGHEDVWYATNIEICEYDFAAKSLEYSSDGKIVHNPTAITVWLDKNGPIKVEPGETVHF